MRRFRAGLRIRLIRRRDHAVLRTEVVGGEASLPILLVEGQPFPPAEAPGYFLAKASAAAELRRGGYALLLAVEGEVVP